MKKDKIFEGLVSLFSALFVFALFVYILSANRFNSLTRNLVLMLAILCFIGAAIFFVLMLNERKKEKLREEFYKGSSQERFYLVIHHAKNNEYIEPDFAEKNNLIEQLFNAQNDFPEMNKSKFVSSGTEFEVEGKFFIKKDFNNKVGYHLAFEISSNKVVDQNANLDSAVGYDGFTISVAYFDGVPLNTPENETGVVIEDIQNLSGSTINLKNDSQFNFTINTVEFDDIDYGMIKILDFNEKFLTICYKFAVLAGLNDVVMGSVKLKRDAEGDSSL